MKKIVRLPFVEIYRGWWEKDGISVKQENEADGSQTYRSYVDVGPQCCAIGGLVRGVYIYL